MALETACPHDTDMTEAEKLVRDLDTLRQSIQLDWQDLAKAPDQKTRDGVLEHLMWCFAELDGLRKRLEAHDA